MSERHPDLGDPDTSFIFQHRIQQAEHERKMREAEEALLARWNPVGRWDVVIHTTTVPTRNPVTDCLVGPGNPVTVFHLVDRWRDTDKFQQYCDVYGGYDTVNGHIGTDFKTKEQLIEFAEKVNRETFLKYKNELIELYIEEVNHVLKEAFLKLYIVQNTVNNLNKITKHFNTLEGDNG